MRTNVKTTALYNTNQQNIKQQHVKDIITNRYVAKKCKSVVPTQDKNIDGKTLLIKFDENTSNGKIIHKDE